MSNINHPLDRSDFLPGANAEKSRRKTFNLRRNSDEKKSEIESATRNDVKVDITSKVKDFSKIKSLADKVPNIDNSKKIEEIKRRVESGTYNIDYEGLADKILRSEF